jgi:hypothetical protein
MIISECRSIFDGKNELGARDEPEWVLNENELAPLWLTKLVRNLTLPIHSKLETPIAGPSYTKGCWTSS